MTALELHEIQGNVLRGYGHPHAGHLAVRVLDGASGRRLIRELLPAVTPASPWSGPKPTTMLNIAVSHAGLSALDIDAKHLRTFPAEFRQGMEARATGQLRDVDTSDPAFWEEGLRGGDIHVLVSVHARTPADLEEHLTSVRERVACKRGLAVGHVQYTAALQVGGGRREHFGYADGMGQPAIEGIAERQYPGQGVPTGPAWKLTPVPHRERAGWQPVKAGEFILGYHDEDGVLPPAPAAPLGRNGTFMVYRKLEQDVARFRKLVRELAEQNYGRDSRNLDLAAAKIVGRWPDGTPLALSRERMDAAIAGDPARVNDFRFDDDPDGRGCPLGAHIRRANPRASLPGKGERTRRHRIVRRGMPYGPPLDKDAHDDDGSPRGLLFICFQASIVRQFEVVNRWCVQGSAVGLGQERDYLTDSPPDGMTLQGDPPVFLKPHGPLVTTRGGEYLFVPGVTALEAIGAERPRLTRRRASANAYSPAAREEG